MSERLDLTDRRMKLLVTHPVYHNLLARRLNFPEHHDMELRQLSSEVFDLVHSHLSIAHVSLDAASDALEDPAVTVKACSLGALGRLAVTDDCAADKIYEFASLPSASEMVIQGVQLRHIAIGCLLKAQTAHSRDLAGQLQLMCRGDHILDQYLKGEGVT